MLAQSGKNGANTTLGFNLAPSVMRYEMFVDEVGETEACWIVWICSTILLTQQINNYEDNVNTQYKCNISHNFWSVAF